MALSSRRYGKHVVSRTANVENGGKVNNANSLTFLCFGIERIQLVVRAWLSLFSSHFSIADVSCSASNPVDVILLLRCQHACAPLSK